MSAILRGNAGLVLDMIVEDVGLTTAVRRYRIHRRWAKAISIDALDAWAEYMVVTRRLVKQADLDRAEAQLEHQAVSDTTTATVRWPYPSSPKIGDLHLHGGRVWRIKSFAPEDLASYAEQEVRLILEPY